MSTVSMMTAPIFFSECDSCAPAQESSSASYFSTIMETLNLDQFMKTYAQSFLPTIELGETIVKQALFIDKMPPTREACVVM